MKLFIVPLAPKTTKVMLYIAEREALGVQMQIEQIVVNTVKGRHKEPEHLARNPFGTVPTLELDDGSFLVESLPIVDYLEDKFPRNTLYAGTPEESARARDLERIVDLRIGGPMGAYGHATKSPLGRPPEPKKAAQYMSALQTPMDFLEQLLSDDRSLLGGESVNVADCTLQSSLQFMRFIEVDVFGERPYLRAWDERYRERPAAKAVLKW
jgi:glutathione S-transferase